MGVATTTRVWEHSKQEDSALVVLLALADWADGDGISWYKIDKIAERCRKGIRQTQYLIERLEDSGELFRQVGRGRGNSSIYTVLSGRSETDIADILIRRFKKSLDDAKAVASILTQKQKVQPKEKVQRTAPIKKVQSSAGFNKKGATSSVAEPHVKGAIAKQPGTLDPSVLDPSTNTDPSDSKTPKPPLGVESRNSNLEYETSDIQIDVSTVDPGRALQPSPPVPGSPSPFDLETELMLVAMRRVTGLDYRLIPQVLEDVREYLKCGYTAEDIADAQQVCMKSDWKWTDKTHGNASRIMDLSDIKKYIGAQRARTNVFKYDPEMQLGELINRVREAGDIRAIDAGWQPALPAEVE